MTNKLLWDPKQSARATSQANHLEKFAEYLRVSGDYFQLHKYSVTNPEDFWSKLWDYVGLLGRKGAHVLSHKPGDDFCDSQWFNDSYINYAENILHLTDKKGRDIITFISEGNKKTTISYEELHSQVLACSASLRACGICKGDVVVGWLANCPYAIVAMLATARVGAIWSSCSPDFGVAAILDRFGQLNPKLIFTHEYYSYKGKKFSMEEGIDSVVAKISSTQDVVPDVVKVPFLESAGDWEEFLAKGKEQSDAAIEVEFNHPLFIMFSSGTTGKPKCIVHSHGGVTLKHTAELFLNTDLSSKDTLFYFTTCGWMMWNWMVSGLLCGAKLVLYDGNPFYPDASRLLKLWSDERVSVAGVSAKLIEGLNKCAVAGEDYNLEDLRMICSTGSPLSTEGYNYVYENISKDLCLASISGGTDILGCFVMGSPSLPVYCGEIQAATMGMDIAIYDEQGAEVSDGKGELVCRTPFPSVPIMFWGDDSNKSALRSAYFSKFPGVWTHGDYIEKTPRGGYVIYGRSDNTLNPGGVRIGTAEIYRQVEKVEQVIDSLAVGQQWLDDTRIVLFVVLRAGITLDDALIKIIKDTIRDNTSPRHVPARVIAVPDLPRTISGKISEQAVRCAIHAMPINNLNALANPESLESFKDLEQLES